jgi:hypothetical protein
MDHTKCKKELTFFAAGTSFPSRSGSFFDPAPPRFAAPAKLAPSALKQLPLRALRCGAGCPEKISESRFRESTFPSAKVAEMGSASKASCQERGDEHMDTVFEFVLYLFYGLGGFLSWIGKGRTTTFQEELSDKYKIRNASIAVILFAIVVALIIYVANYA